LQDWQVLFSESQSRLLLEVAPDRLADLKANLHDVPFAVIGEVTMQPGLVFQRGGETVAKVPLGAAERAWKQPLDLDGTLLQEATR
jgi:phosphoribosylformylglycinamidine synthase